MTTTALCATSPWWLSSTVGAILTLVTGIVF